MAAGPLSQADLAEALENLTNELQEVRRAIATEAAQAASGGLSGGLMGLIKTSVQVPLSALGKALAAGAKDNMERSKLLRQQGDVAGADKLKALSEEAAALSLTLGMVGMAFTALLDLPGQLLAMVRSPAAMASPSTESTLQGNLDLLSAKIGKDLIPAMTMLAMIVYGIGEIWSKSPGGRFMAGSLGAMAGNTMVHAIQAMSALGVDFKNMPFDVVGPQAKMTSSVGYADELTIASLNAASKQTEQRLLQLQLEQLTESGQLLKKIEHNTTPKTGSWRG